MKTKFNTVIQAAVVAATLAFSGASHAAGYSATAFDGTGVLEFDGQSFNNTLDINSPYLGVAVYNVTGGGNSYFALCIDPETNALTNASYTAHNANGSVSNSVKQLYETSYAGIAGNVEKQASFQLALWELTHDDGDLYARNPGSKQFFTAGLDSHVDDAAGMLQAAQAPGYTLLNTYNYINFTGNLDGVPSQELLAVTAAVPEADTWAMLVAGLGVVGLVRRRKSAASEKFA